MKRGVDPMFTCLFVLTREIVALICMVRKACVGGSFHVRVFRLSSELLKPRFLFSALRPND